ncbi:MAG: zf-TFIIB domain-containing protein [Myxococcota bacterium]
MNLVACGSCHTQYDVTDVIEKTFACRCGASIENRPPAPVDAPVRRCGACGALTDTEAESCGFCGSQIVRSLDRQLSLICPECYARNAEDSRFCTACGVGFQPEAVRIEGHELPCPVCSCLMPTQQVGGVSVNECGSCNGLWAPGDNFDLLVGKALDARRNANADELVALKPRVTGSNPAAQQVLYRKCPECDAYMHRRNFRKSSGVIIDRCNAHGTWLDSDELEQIAGFILSGRKPSETLTAAPEGPKSASRAAVRSGFARIAQVGGSSRPREGGIVESVVDMLVALLR